MFAAPQLPIEAAKYAPVFYVQIDLAKLQTARRPAGCVSRRAPCFGRPCCSAATNVSCRTSRRRNRPQVRMALQTVRSHGWCRAHIHGAMRGCNPRLPARLRRGEHAGRCARENARPSHCRTHRATASRDPAPAHAPAMRGVFRRTTGFKNSRRASAESPQARSSCATRLVSARLTALSSRSVRCKPVATKSRTRKFQPYAGVFVLPFTA